MMKLVVTVICEEKAAEEKTHDNTFYAIVHHYRRSKHLPRAIKSRMTTLVKSCSQQTSYRSQAEVLRNVMLMVESVHLFLVRG